VPADPHGHRVMRGGFRVRFERCADGEHGFDLPRRPGQACHCGATRLCNQCWKTKPGEMFVRRDGKHGQNCSACRGRLKVVGGRSVEPRRGLPTAGEPRYTFAPRSGNAKLGGIPAVIASGESCPPSCGFYGRGCFAEFGILGAHWRRTSTRGVSFDALLERIESIKHGALWRYAVAGDLPGVGDELDADALARLVIANLGARGFAITHKPLRTAVERRAVAAANALGFTVNLSADTLEQADARAALGVGPVVVVLPPALVSSPHRKLVSTSNLRTPAGRRVVVCPAETRGLDCRSCGLCHRAERRGVVGFIAHGQMAATVGRIATGGTA
jgi:hypothetical protein